jgi:hypothetical protein
MTVVERPNFSAHRNAFVAELLGARSPSVGG